MKRIVSAKEAVSKIKDGSTVMVGGFLSCGAPDKLIDAFGIDGGGKAWWDSLEVCNN